MSISSCPRCGKHVTLPEGIGSQVRVQCPLCQAEYELAEVLANRPPLLLVVDELQSTPWQAPLGALEADELAPQIPHEFQTASDEFASAALGEEPVAGELDAGELDAGELDGGELGGGDGFHDLEAAASAPPAEHLEHDDFSLQEQDTEIEDLGLGAPPADDDAALDFEPLPEQAAGDFEPLDLGETLGEPAAAPDFAPAEPELSFGEPAAEELSFGEPEAAAAGDDEFDFGAPQPAAPSDEVDFGEPDPLATLDSGHAETLDFGEPVDPDATIEFQPGELVQPAGEVDDLVPDFGEAEPLAAAAPVEEPAAEDEAAEGDGKKKKKEKKKKEKKVKAPKAAKAAGEPRKRTLVGTLVTAVLSLVIVVPLVLYGMLWLGPDFDFLNIGRKLPTAMVPAAFNKPKQVAQAPVDNTAMMDMLRKSAENALKNAQQPREPNAGEAPADNEAAPPADQTAEAAEPAPAAAAAEPAEEPAAPAEEPAADKVAEAAPEEPAPTEEEAEAKPALAAGEPAEPAEAPEEPAEAMPAEEPAAVAAEEGNEDLDSLLGTKPEEAKPEEPAEEKVVAKPVAEPEPLEPEEPVGPVNPPRFAAADMAAATQAVGAATKKMNAAQAAKDDAGLKKARKDFYLSLFGLGQVATFIDDPAERDGLKKVASQLAADGKRLDALKTNAARWFGFAKRTTPGIVLAGSVQNVEELGKLYQVNVKVGDGADATVVAVLCGQDPQVAANDEVMTFGSIVENPGQQLSGYEGTDATIVWSGVTMKLPGSGN